MLTDILELTGFLVVVLLVLTFLFAVSRASLLATTASATSSYLGFRQRFWSSVSGWRSVWVASICYILGLMAYLSLQGTFSTMQVVNQFNLLGWIIAMGGLIFASCVFWAPRFKRTWSLLVVSLITAGVLYGTLHGALQWALHFSPDVLAGYSFTTTEGTVSVNYYTPLYLVIPGWLAAWAAWRKRRESYESSKLSV